MQSFQSLCRIISSLSPLLPAKPTHRAVLEPTSSSLLHQTYVPPLNTQIPSLSITFAHKTFSTVRSRSINNILIFFSQSMPYLVDLLKTPNGFAVLSNANPLSILSPVGTSKIILDPFFSNYTHDCTAPG